MSDITPLGPSNQYVGTNFGSSHRTGERFDLFFQDSFDDFAAEELDAFDLEADMLDFSKDEYVTLNGLQKHQKGYPKTQSLLDMD